MMQTNNGMTGVLGNSTPKKQDKVKDSRLAYFRENYVPDADDEDFDPTQYYYKRPEPQRVEDQMNFMQSFSTQNLQNLPQNFASSSNLSANPMNTPSMHPAQLSQQQQQYLLQQQQQTQFLLQQQQQYQQQTLQNFIQQSTPPRTTNVTPTGPSIPTSPYRPSDTIMSIINKQQMPTVNAPSTPLQRQATPSSLKVTSKYGLLGLLSVIHTQDPDLNALALGSDLTTLGLNLNSREYLYPNFSSPWNDQKSFIQPEFSVPNCYKTHGHMEIRQQYLDNFKDETLFYIFYSMPRDAMQMIAARELQKRKWIWLRDNQVWINTTTAEFFDVNTWKKTASASVVLNTVLQQQQNQYNPDMETVDGLDARTEDLHNFVNLIAREENERTGSQTQNGAQQKGSSDIAKQGNEL